MFDKDFVTESIERGYCSYPFMESDPLLAGLRRDPELASGYTKVRAAGRACHEAFLSHIGAT